MTVMIGKEETCSLIKPDGNLWIGPKIFMADLLKQGWREVHNPKRTYYPEYDQTHPSYKKEQVIVDDTNDNILIVESI